MLFICSVDCYSDILLLSPQFLFLEFPVVLWTCDINCMYIVAITFGINVICIQLNYTRNTLLFVLRRLMLYFCSICTYNIKAIINYDKYYYIQHSTYIQTYIHSQLMRILRTYTKYCRYKNAYTLYIIQFFDYSQTPRFL